ncbi:MAG: hypothetical protein PVG71_09890 [Anaerolineae bacterium]
MPSTIITPTKIKHPLYEGPMGPTPATIERAVEEQRMAVVRGRAELSVTDRRM